MRFTRKHKRKYRRKSYAGGNIHIPKTIYMCHKSLDDLKGSIDRWKKLNPEYTIKPYNNNMCEEFLLKEYSQKYLDVFKYIPDGPIKCDFWRACIINAYGGLYVDADIIPVASLNTYIDNDDDFVTCISINFNKNNPEWQFNPHFILSNKNSKVLQDTIHSYLKLYDNKIPYSYWDYSICKLFKINKVIDKKSHILYIDNMKYKFIYEQTPNDYEYNGKIIFHNSDNVK